MSLVDFVGVDSEGVSSYFCVTYRSRHVYITLSRVLVYTETKNKLSVKEEETHSLVLL